MPGDVVDEDIRPVIKQNLGELFKSIKNKFGVYSVTGNHEYIGGIEKSVKYLTDHGIRVLRDEAILINNSFYLAGREDRASFGFAGIRRKNLSELLNNIDRRYPVIVMDHQPVNLEEAVENHVDVQLSGHTHHAQMWPLSYITKRVYELSWGYLKKGKTHFYVSTGAGTWGPPVRIGNIPEIVQIKLNLGINEV
jgi:predicted MPP superfamily phosphohydrolase